MELSDVISPKFNLKRHAIGLREQLLSMKVKLTSLDAQRIYIVFIILNSIDMLDMLDEVLSQSQKNDIIDWIYRQQIVRRITSTNELIGGFRGSEALGFHTEYDTTQQPAVAVETLADESERHHDQSMIVFTQCAIQSLLIIGDDLSRISRPHLYASLTRVIDATTGNVRSTCLTSESDVRFIYSSLVIGKLLGDLSAFTNENTLQAILRLQTSTDSAFALYEDSESHGGSTFCAIAALDILNSLPAIPNRTRLLHWLINRQQLLIDQAQQLDPEDRVEIEIISEAEYNQQKLNEQAQKASKQSIDSHQQSTATETETTTTAETTSITTTVSINQAANTEVDAATRGMNPESIFGCFGTEREQQQEQVQVQDIQQSQKEECKYEKQTLNCCGFQGRMNKFPDSCYTTWIGASLAILGQKDWIASTNVERYLKLCEHFEGGFKKYPFELKPDPIHTMFSIIGLTLTGAIKLSNNDSIDYALLLRKSRLIHN